VGKENFDWIVNAVAEMAINLAQRGGSPAKELRWSEFLSGIEAAQPASTKSK
jgi:hypothetical protein